MLKKNRKKVATWNSRLLTKEAKTHCEHVIKNCSLNVNSKKKSS